MRALFPKRNVFGWPGRLYPESRFFDPLFATVLARCPTQAPSAIGVVLTRWVAPPRPIGVCPPMAERRARPSMAVPRMSKKGVSDAWLDFSKAFWWKSRAISRPAKKDDGLCRVRLVGDGNSAKPRPHVHDDRYPQTERSTANGRSLWNGRCHPSTGRENVFGPISTTMISGDTPKRTGSHDTPKPPDTIMCRPPSTICP